MPPVSAGNSTPIPCVPLVAESHPSFSFLFYLPATGFPYFVVHQNLQVEWENGIEFSMFLPFKKVYVKKTKKIN